MLLADCVCRLETFPRVARRHPNVDDHQVGTLFVDELHQLGRVSALTEDLVARTLE
jgi:hypothetical protein